MRSVHLILPLALLATAGLLAQQVPELEPNDTPATAQAITAGQHINASFATTTDEDWFAFTLPAPGQANLRTVNQGTLSLSTTRDTRIALYDATGTTRLAWNDTASLDESAVAYWNGGATTIARRMLSTRTFLK